MKLNLKINSMLLCLALFAACSSDDDGQVAQDSSQEQKQPQKTYPLSIEVAENPMVQEGEGGSSRRAPITTGSSLNSFNLSYGYGEYCSSSPITTNKNGEGKWVNSAGADKGWPDADDNVVYWYAYTDGTFNYNSGSPYISLTVDQNTFYQKDLMVSTASGTYASTSGKLSFTFDHVCSALKFQVKKANNLDDYRLDISDIKLCNIVSQGKYSYSAGTWSWDLPASRSEYTLSSGTMDNLSKDGYQNLTGGTGPYLFLIPQELTAWNPSTNATGAYIKITCTLTLKSPSTEVYDGVAYIPFAKVLEKSTKYNISINIGKNSLYNASGSLIVTP